MGTVGLPSMYVTREPQVWRTKSWSSSMSHARVGGLEYAEATERVVGVKDEDKLGLLG